MADHCAKCNKPCAPNSHLCWDHLNNLLCGLQRQDRVYDPAYGEYVHTRDQGKRAIKQHREQVFED